MVEHRGDEWLHYLADKEGNVYQKILNEKKAVSYRRISGAEFGVMKEKAAKRQGDNPRIKRLFPNAAGSSIQGGAKKIGFKPTSLFQGTKKGLVILAEFNDVQFSNNYTNYGVNNVNALYQRIVNEVGFQEGSFYGSVRDYFRKQSIREDGALGTDGKDYQFDLDFDVVGPVTLSKTQEYYGTPLYKKSGNTYQLEDNDAHAGAMVAEAIKKVISNGLVSDFSIYDWDGDYEIDQVFVLYADKGEADGGGSNMIWPHEWNLNSSYSYENQYENSKYYYTCDVSGNYKRFEKDANFNGAITVTTNGTNYRINTYACSNELSSVVVKNSSGGYDVVSTKISGIGTICHEFSHCLGYPDMYDTQYSGNYGMGYWDLMASGSYNGDGCGYRPAGYTSFERWAAGWIDPEVLSDPRVVTNMSSLQSTAQAYVVYARGNTKEGEYFLLENRQYDAWDYDLPWRGLLILHVDYHSSVWSNNRVNTTNNVNSNGHQRCTVFHADLDEAGFLDWSTYPYEPDYWLPIAFAGNSSVAGKTGAQIASYFNSKYSSDGVNLGQSFNNQLTASSNPAAIIYNSTDASATSSAVWQNHEIHHITQNQNGTIDFIYRYPTDNVVSGTLNLHETATESSADSYVGGKTYKKVVLNRTFTTGKWNTLWLPFKLSPTEVRQAFGNDAQVALFTGTSTTTEGENTTININFSLRKNSNNVELTSGTNAFEPFLIKVGTECVNPSFEYVTILDGSDRDATLTKNGWTFVGTKTVGNIPNGSFFISGDGFYKSVGLSNTKAYRGYFTPSSAIAPTVPDASLVKQFFTREMDENARSISVEDIQERFEFTQFLTTIDGVMVDVDSEETDFAPGIYSLSGQRISASTSELNSLPRGIYLVNGKKYEVK